VRAECQCRLGRSLALAVERLVLTGVKGRLRSSRFRRAIEKRRGGRLSFPSLVKAVMSGFLGFP
jgi:hypothetical protein